METNIISSKAELIIQTSASTVYDDTWLENIFNLYDDNCLENSTLQAIGNWVVS